MSKNKKILCLIPARGGSKGLPGKNIKMLVGKPLIAYTIEQALGCRYLDRVIVSTDDQEIAQVSKKFGAEVPFLRPEELAQDDSSTMDVISHALDWLGDRGDYFDILVLLEPTSPLRKKDDLDKAIELFFKNIDQADSLISLGEIQLESPYISKTIEQGYAKPLMRANKNAHQRQQRPRVYFPYGVIYLSKIDTLKKHKTFYQEKTLPYFIERWQNYEIDDIYDFTCIEAIMKNL